MTQINCPMCGKPNPADRDVCQYCEARLKPLTDELSRSQPPIRPGEEPTEMDTGQLESVLPQWLRDIRRQARESTDEEPEQPPAAKDAGQQAEKADLLAGLHSQSEGDEEIPDWLAGLRDEGGQADFQEAPAEEDDLAAMRRMLGETIPDTQEGQDKDLPGWITDRDVNEAEQAEGDDLSSFFETGATEEQAQTDSVLPASNSDLGWDANFEADSLSQAGAPADETAFDTELPAWLRDTDQPQHDETESGLPAWLESEKPASPPESEGTASSSEGELPAWLASLGEEETTEIPPAQDTDSAIKSTADWLASLEKEETTGAALPQETSPAASESETLDWLSSLSEESGEASFPQEPEDSAGTGDLPGWLAALGEENDEPLPQEGEQPSGESKAPSWLSSLREESLEEEGTEDTGRHAEELEPSSFASGQQSDETGVPPTFVDDEGEPISSEDVEAIFSMDMPDWLSDAKRISEGETTPAEAEPQADELRPAELPSWVQAMRPVESVISETEGTPFEEQPIEESGPLAGLRGVLPAVPGIGPSSKPKSYSVKLQASEDQQSNAALLEKMLAEEVNPKPVSAQKVVLSQRLLRLAITVLFLAIVALVFFSGTRINPIPDSVLPETKAVLDYVQAALPANAPVLLVFDYQAARAGELEASAAPIIDQMLTLKAPRLSLLSSTPTGTGLAERFMGILQADRTYARNETFVNLGYLPGGAAGVQAFTGNPVTTKPLTTTGEDAWTTPVLQGVSQLSNFAAIILLTDDGETARIWIEQTEGSRGETQFLVISSAQAGPLIMPYVRSGQVNGIVTGLDSSAPIEQANSGRPGMARRYWDAFGFGLLTAVLMIALGALWSMVSSFQALRKEQGKG